MPATQLQQNAAAFLLLAGMTFLEADEEEPLIQALRLAPYNQVADFLDGTARTGKSVPHAERWWEQTGRYLSSAQFKTAFRCRKTTFRELVVKLYGTTDLCRKGGRGPLFDPCERVGVFMWRMGGGCTVRQTALHFKLSEGTVSQVTLEVAKLAEERLKGEYVHWPSLSEQEEISTQWEREKSLRGVVGAIDGSHIEILAPPELKQLAYYNYKNFYSISLVAIVDNEGMFRWFCSGAPGSCGDNGVFKDTSIYERAEAEQDEPANQRTVLLEGACILGDSAFAEGAWMRTPIGACTTRAQRFFNYKHSSMRFRVEHAFGRLKRKFRSLGKGLDCRLKHCSVMVDACVILYNFIFKHEGESPADHGADVDPDQTRNGTGAHSAGVGPASSERAREVAYLSQHFLQREWGVPGSRADRQRRADEMRMRRNNGT